MFFEGQNVAETCPDPPNAIVLYSLLLHLFMGMTHKMLEITKMGLKIDFKSKKSGHIVLKTGDEHVLLLIYG